MPIPVKGTFGLVFTLAVVIVAVIYLPAARWLLAVSIPTGLLIALVLRLINRD